MKFLQRLSTTLFICCLLLGCVTIEENYTFKYDGSGNLEYVIDMTELGEMLKGFESSDGDVQKDQKTNIDSMAQVISSMKGIKKVKTIEKEWIQKISFDFEDIDALNNALTVVSQKGSQWTKNGKAFTRTQTWVDPMPESDSEEGMNADDILEKMEYVVTVKTKKPVKLLKSESQLEIYQEKKKITVKSNTKEIKDNPNILTFSFKIK